MLPEDNPGISEIYELLRLLGITANYTCFFYVSYAVYLAARQPDRLLLVTKWLYPEVARFYTTTWKCIERSIRTAVDIVWAANAELLEKLACRPLPEKPKGSQFIAILAMHFSMNSAA